MLCGRTIACAMRTDRLEEQKPSTSTNSTSSNPPTLLACQKSYNRRDISYFTHSCLCRCRIYKRFEIVDEVLRAVVVPICCHWTGIDAIYRDTFALPKFRSPNASKRFVGGLAGRVDCMLRDTHAGRTGGQKDDAAAAGHVGDDFLSEKDRRYANNLVSTSQSSFSRTYL
jgi:hypothetical protein